MAGAASFVSLGWQSAVQLNGQTFGVKSGRIKCQFDRAECGDTISGQDKMSKGGRGEMSVTLEFYEKSNQNNRVAPIAVFEGEYITISIWPKGAVAEATPYACSFFYIESYEISHDIDGKVSGTLTGYSSGGYSSPGGSF